MLLQTRCRCGFKLLYRSLQLLLIRRGECWKLNADPLGTGPTDNGVLNQHGSLAVWEKELKIHFHSREGLKRALDPAALTGQIQCLINGVASFLMNN